MTSSSEAHRLILQSAPVLETETIPFRQATGCILRRSLIADRDWPPFDRVMMDGIALWVDSGGKSGKSYPLEGCTHAGAPQVRLGNGKAAWEVNTGCVLPAGCNAVIPKEHYEKHENHVEVHDAHRVQPWAWIHRQGSDYPRGAVLVPAGRPLGAREMAVAASCGKVEVEVARLPRIALISTGDELIPPEVVPQAYQIRQSNAYALESLVYSRHLGTVEVHHLPDDEAVMVKNLRGLLPRADVMVLSGGVSRGERDFVPGILERLGVETVFHGVAQRPGKPFWFGTHQGGPLVFGFPGNPLSTLVGGCRYLVPTLQKMLGVRPLPLPGSVPLGSDFSFPPPLTLFLPVKLLEAPTGARVAQPCPANNSGDYASVVHTDGFLELPPDREHFQRGEVYPFTPW